jgi:hypothetical protein
MVKFTYGFAVLKTIKTNLEETNAECIRLITEITSKRKLDDRLYLTFLYVTSPVKKNMRYWDDLYSEYLNNLETRKGQLKKVWLKLLKQLS